MSSSIPISISCTNSSGLSIPTGISISISRTSCLPCCPSKARSISSSTSNWSHCRLSCLPWSRRGKGWNRGKSTHSKGRGSSKARWFSGLPWLSWCSESTRWNPSSTGLLSSLSYIPGLWSSGRSNCRSSSSRCRFITNKGIESRGKDSNSKGRTGQSTFVRGLTSWRLNSFPSSRSGWSRLLFNRSI